MPSSSHHRLFVTGTDTGVGKTRVAARLVETLRASGINAVVYKPILCGEDRSDAEALSQASGGLDLDTINPIWLKTPAAPLSARIAGENAAAHVDRCLIFDTYEALTIRFDAVIIEGAGGWEVPLTETETFAQLAKSFAAPVVVVAANRLGVLNHTRLTVDAIRRDGLTCVGVLLNEISPPDPADIARRTNLEALRLTLPDVPIDPVGWNDEGPFPEALRLRLFP